jgi:hypothetical protein
VISSKEYIEVDLTRRAVALPPVLFARAATGIKIMFPRHGAP